MEPRCLTTLNRFGVIDARNVVDGTDRIFVPERVESLRLLTYGAVLNAENIKIFLDLEPRGKRSIVFL